MPRSIAPVETQGIRMTSPPDKHAPEPYRHRVRAGFTRKALAQWLGQQGYRTGAEIGVADGRYSTVLCEQIPDLRLLCVDPWRPYRGNPRGGPAEQHDGNYARAAARLAPYHARMMRAQSMDAVREVPEASLDFVYIDGHHSFDWVMQDLIEWSKRVRSGGVVAGHDFYHFRWAGVVEAVAAYTTAHGIADWWLCDEREPSFWWVKP